MINKSKRILWLLNHKTLMPFEVALLIDLGFEVFTPKIIPDAKSGFRSAGIDFSYDGSLTLPKRVLERLNEFNFYEKSWPADIVRITNRYFGTTFIMPFASQVIEAVKKFEGKIIFRTFGLENTKTYKSVLDFMYGSDVFSRIYALRHRFWFGEGYEQLHECEPPLFAERAIYLPIGLPTSFWKYHNKWNGSLKKILFVCPNLVSNPYYAEIYRAFKEKYGDLPHVIVGAQDELVEDPNVLGYVSSEELEQLYLNAAVLYYHSTELRHVHYSPIEAAINGMPVIFFKNSLLGKMTDDAMAGKVETEEEARAMLERVLAGDTLFIEKMRAEQQSLAYKFSEDFCKPIWQQNLAKMGLERCVQPEQKFNVFVREAKRFALAPIAQGLSSLNRQERLRLVPRSVLAMPFEEDLGEHSLEEGIDFRLEKYPAFILSVTGISGQEFWGRWTDGKKAVIVLDHYLKGQFQLAIVGGAYGRNIGKAFKVRIGKTVRLAKFSTKADMPEKILIDFKLEKPAHIIEISIPSPESPPNDSRTVGFGLVHMQIVKTN